MRIKKEKKMHQSLRISPIKEVRLKKDRLNVKANSEMSLKLRDFFD